MKHVLITGAWGFIGKNLRLRLRERKDLSLLLVGRDTTEGEFVDFVSRADVIFHCAGENRPADPAQFDLGNRQLTQRLCDLVKSAGRRPVVVLTSSTQSLQDNPYGRSKVGAEQSLTSVAESGYCAAVIYRLPNVFGKWARPNYNSAVATFCHNTARDLPISINDPSATLSLVYIDDVLDQLVQHVDETPNPGVRRAEVQPIFKTTVGTVAQLITAFKNSRSNLISEDVGHGLTRALYATYVSYLPTAQFAYPVEAHTDPRGSFVEMLKTKSAGQFSFFTAHPGVTRGGHYHHSKTEKFLVIKGEAVFKFRQMESGEFHELRTHGDAPCIVETVPGWTHDITNVGTDTLIVMLWANEIFDRSRPDTYACPV